MSAMQNTYSGNGTTPPPQTKQTRLRNGCQQCKEHRVKCDKTKPACRKCVRKGLECDYARKLMWITLDNCDSRHPSYKRRGTGAAKLQKESIGKESANDMLNVDSDYKALHSSYNNSKNDQLSISVPTQNSDQKEEQKQLLLAHDSRFSSFFRSLPQGSFNVFKSSATESLFAHYLLVTCAALDPLNGIGPNNISEKFFVPFAVSSPASLHGILSLSSAQLAITNPSDYSELTIRHKSLSYKHLYALLADPQSATGITVMSTILALLSLEVIESKSTAWLFHIHALRSIVQERARRMQEPIDDELTQLIYLRVARYDCFASLITGEEPLFEELRVESEIRHPSIRNIDGVFGCPANILLFCAQLTSLSRRRWELVQGLMDYDVEKANRALGVDEKQLQNRLASLLESTSDTIQSREWILCEDLWKCALDVRFWTSVKDRFEFDCIERRNTCVQKFMQSLHELIENHEGGYYCTNLLFPIFQVMLITDEQQGFRDELMTALDTFYVRTSIGSFQQAKSVISDFWKMRSRDELLRPSSWWTLSPSRSQWKVFMA